MAEMKTLKKGSPEPRERIFYHGAFHLFVIALAAFIVYGNIYGNEFVFDGIKLIEENRSIRDLTGLLEGKNLFRPRGVVDFTFALNFWAGQTNVFGYHLVNVLLHILNGFVVYFLARTLLWNIFQGNGREGGLPPLWLSACSLFAALLFVVHPVQTQAVTYTVQRYASMAALFYMAAVLFYLRGRMAVLGRRDSGIVPAGEDGGTAAKSPEKGKDGKKRKRKTPEHVSPAPALPAHASVATEISYPRAAVFFVLAVFSGLLAVLSKQNAVSLPLALLLAEFFCFRGSAADWKRKLPWIGGTALFFIVSGLLVFGLGDLLAGRGNLLEDAYGLTRETTLVSRSTYLFTQFNVLVIYLRLFVLPVHQNADYMMPFVQGFFTGVTPWAFLFLVGLLSLAVWKNRRWPVFAFAVLWFFVTLSVESSLIPIRDALFEHRLYLPLFGFALFLADLLFRLFSRQSVLAVAVAVALIVSYGTAAHLRNRVWLNETTLWSDVLSKSPWNIRAYNNLGLEKLKAGQAEESIALFRKSLDLHPSYPDALINLAGAYSRLGRVEEARAIYEKLLEEKTGVDGEMLARFGNLFYRKGDTAEALKFYSRAAVADPRSPQIRYNLALVLGALGRQEDAIASLREAVRLDPFYQQARERLGVTLAGMGRLDEAADHLEAAARLDPPSPNALSRLGDLRMIQGRAGEAEKAYREALRIRPDDAQARMSLGAALARQREYEEAVTAFREAMTGDSRVEVTAFYQIARVRAAQGRNEDAVTALKKAVERGFRNGAFLANDGDLAGLRDRADFKGLLEDLEKRQKAAGTGESTHETGSK